MSEEQPQKESYVDEAKRRIAHLSYKLEQAQDRVNKDKLNKGKDAAIAALIQTTL